MGKGKERISLIMVIGFDFVLYLILVKPLN